MARASSRRNGGSGKVRSSRLHRTSSCPPSLWSSHGRLESRNGSKCGPVPRWDEMLLDCYRMHLEALGMEGVGEPVELGGVARLAFDVDRRVLGRQAGEDALVIDLDDVDLVGVEQFHHRGK